MSYYVTTHEDEKMHINIVYEFFLYSDQMENLLGHRLRIVSVPVVPYMDYQREGQEQGDRVTPKDSIDVRLIKAFSKTLNFT